MYDYRISMAKNEREEKYVKHFYLNIQNNDFKKDINKSDQVKDINCNQFEYDHEKSHDHEEFDITKLMIINHQGPFVAILSLVDVVLCLVSSWVYMWMTVFAIEGVDIEWMEYYTHYIEIFFFFTMCIGFFTDFKKPGEHISEKKLSVISKRYLH